MEREPVSMLPSQPTQTSESKRSSLPAGKDVRSKKRSSNRVRPQAASPEVISSLIDSLSAISLDAQAHFENIPKVAAAEEGKGKRDRSKGRGASSHSVPSSPAPWQADSGNDGGGFGVQYGVHRNERWEDEVPDPDAAEPPVVRTSKPASVKGRERESSLKSYMMSSKSSASLHSKRSQESVGSIASNMVPGLLRRQSTTSRASLESRRSKSSGKLPSLKERLQGKENSGEIRKIPRSAPAPILTKGLDTLSPPTTPGLNAPRSPRSPRSPWFRAESDQQAKPESSGSSWRFKKKPGPITIPSGPFDPDERSPRVPLELVPERGSSTRHSSESPSNRRRKNRSRAGSSRTRTVIEEDEDAEEAPEWKGKGKAGVEPAGKARSTSPSKSVMQQQQEEIEDYTTRRIKELKQRKEMRAREAGAGAAERTQAAAPSSPESLPSPGSQSSDNVEERPIEDSMAKAHKLLGLTTAAVPRALPGRSKSFTNGEARPVAEEPAPLPIDYNAALQQLGRSESSHSDKTPTARHGSLGRRPSAVGTDHSDSPLAGLDYPIAYFDSPPDSRVNSRQGSCTATTDPGQRQNSLYVPNQPPWTASNKDKQRWSHPDLPLKAEQKHNAKLERDTMAVKAPQVPEPVLEEPPRPSSSDSVDDDVDAFLYSPRLSQKVREPTTGRTICFSEVGDPEGFAVFVCVGMGLTRYITAFYDELAASLKLRLITPDRPGVGESQADPHGTPLSWPDDVSTICSALRITKFSIMAHSAGAIYALATAMRMPTHIRGRVHLLAPWIPPSQMTSVGLHTDSPPDRQLPKAQRLLRVLPTPFLRVANSSFMSATSASITRSVPKSPQRSKKKAGPTTSRADPPAMFGANRQAIFANGRSESMMMMDRVLPDGSLLETDPSGPIGPTTSAAAAQAAQGLAEAERRRDYDTRLTLAVWDLATTNANPAVDLLVCLERRQPIGFRYADVRRPMMIHHGSKDSRVPVENVKWLARSMKRCEVRILEGEGHGLMASAAVMGNVLTEMAKEWEDWMAVVQGGGTGSAAAARRPAIQREGSYGSYAS